MKKFSTQGSQKGGHKFSKPKLHFYFGFRWYRALDALGPSAAAWPPAQSICSEGRGWLSAECCGSVGRAQGVGFKSFTGLGYEDFRAAVVDT